MWRGQCYQSLRTSCLEEGQLFVDPAFPHVTSDPEVDWKRPHEFCTDPKFIERGASTTDICQGELGDCWLLSSISALTLSPSLFSRVVPEGQSFSAIEGYSGIFHFRLWHFGSWVDVVVDDTLPTKRGQLLYTKSDTKGEMWSALLEKAYAKVCGGYPTLQGGCISEALEDFTGGIAECVNVSTLTPEETWAIVSQSEHGAVLMGCCIQVSQASDIGRINEEGLVLGHAYTVIGASKVRCRSKEVCLLRLRNPWGFIEYKGPWSDKSLEWESVAETERKELNLQKEDGEFWMLCHDFSRLFSCLFLCGVTLDSLHWGVTQLRGRWKVGVSAGGGRRLKSFFSNPQFRLQVGGALPQEEEPGSGRGVEPKLAHEAELHLVLLQLLQTNRQTENLHIACHLYRVPEEQVKRPRLDRGFFTRNRPVGDTGQPQNSRGVTLRVSLPPGEYVIVPSTDGHNQEGEFYIRVYCDKGTKSRVNDNFLSTYNCVQGDTLDALHFQQLVNSGLTDRFCLSLETCRSLMFDVDSPLAGRVTQQEAELILTRVRFLQEVYMKFSTDASDPLSSYELPLALQEAGFELSRNVLESLWLRYQTGDLTVTFSDFIHCVTKVHKIFVLYRLEDSSGSRDINEWILRFLAL
ncbi:calpain-1 catalytic subunit-like isoform X2 [Ascaphus truei]|uniref:calpain-1 catalytic subunit-like isoform X2 n=1 Tax=Ascaphus truei TaxID=8439 RepID=UPI003F59759D